MNFFFSITAEYLPPTRRGFFITVVAWWWMVGSIMTAALAWITMGALGLSWHWFAAAASVPAWLGVVFTVVYLPESPRFLYISKDFQGASEALAFIARQCRVPPSLGVSARELQNDYDIAATANRTEPASESLTFLGDEGVPREGWKDRLLKWWNGETVAGKDNLLALFHPALLRTTITTIGVWWTISFGELSLFSFFISLLSFLLHHSPPPPIIKMF